MLNKRLIGIVTCALTFLVVFSSPVNAGTEGNESGGCGGHGGDARSLEFYRLGKSLASQFRKIQDESPEDFEQLPGKFLADELDKAVESTRIVSRPEPLISNGNPVDAKNHTEDKSPWIEIQSTRWDSYSGDRDRKIAIVLHEYLGITRGLYHHGEWDNYQLSDRLLSIYERKVVIEPQVVHDRQIETLKANFRAAQRPSPEQLQKALSCVEISALRDDSSKFIHEDAYLWLQRGQNNNNLGSWQNGVVFQQNAANLFRQWEDKDPTESVDHPKNKIKEFIRVSPRGDLIVELTTDYLYENQSPAIAEPGRGVLAYLSCSSLASETLSQLRFMRDSLIPVLNIQHTPSFTLYVSKMEGLQKTPAYKRCTKDKKYGACKRTLRRMNRISVTSEAATVETAKSNINLVNIWLNGLSELDNSKAAEPLNDLFNRFVVHQANIKSLMQLDDGPSKNDSIRLDSFIDSLIHRLPVAYEEARLSFLKEYENIRDTLILDSAN